MDWKRGEVASLGSTGLVLPAAAQSPARKVCFGAGGWGWVLLGSTGLVLPAAAQSPAHKFERAAPSAADPEEKSCIL